MNSPAIKLTDNQRAILIRTPDSLKGVAGGFFHPSRDHHDLEAAGLLHMENYGSMGGGFVARYVRTDLAREALRHEQ